MNLLDYFTNIYTLLYIALIAGFSIATVYTYAWLRDFMQARKGGILRCIILQKRPQGYYKIGERKISAKADSFTWRDKTFLVDATKIAYFNPHAILLYDENQAEPLKFNPSVSEGVNSKTAHFVLKQQVIKQLVAATRTQKLDLVMLIAFALIGLMAGFILGQYVHITPTPTPSK